MQSGAPQVITNSNQKIYVRDPATNHVSETLAAKTIIQQIPVYQPSYQFSVPPVRYNRGWTAPSVPPVPGPTYTRISSAPDVPFVHKSYASLVQASSNPSQSLNRSGTQLSAPSIMTTYGS